MKVAWLSLLFLCGNVYAGSHVEMFRKQVESMVRQAELDLQLVQAPVRDGAVLKGQVRKPGFHSFYVTTRKSPRLTVAYRCKRCLKRPVCFTNPSAYFKHWVKYHRSFNSTNQ